MMVTCESKTILPYVEAAYASDQDLLDKWHVISGSGLKRCVERTIDDLEKMESLKFYTVHEGDHFVGYFGVEFDGHYMPTVFIMPAFRKRKAEFWQEIEAKVPWVWKAGIYAKNLRCLRFYSKMGREVARLKSPSGEIAVFEFKRGA